MTDRLTTARPEAGKRAMEQTPTRLPLQGTPTDNAVLPPDQACAARRRSPGPAAATRSAQGRPWTATPLPARPRHAADHAKKDHSSPPRHLTGPAPSGMTDSLTAYCPLWTVGRLV